MFVDDSAPPAQTSSRTHLSTDHNSSTATSPGQETAASQRANNAEASSQKDATETGNNREAESEAVVPIAVFVGLQSAAGAPADTVIETGGTTPVANPPATLPGETASLALARVAQDTETQDTQINPQVPADAAATEQPAPDAPKIPAIAVPAQADGNAALETVTDLTARIPAEAAAVEASAKLQTAISTTPEGATEHGRLIASASAQPLLSPLKPSTPPDTQTLKPEGNQHAAKPTGPDAPKTEPHPVTTRNTGQQDGNSGDKAPLASIAADKTSAAQSPTVDTGTFLDIVPSAVSTSVHTSAVPQLTAAPINPNVAVPVTALAVEIATNVQIGRSRFEIRLDPPELGRIEVKLDVDRQGQVTSHIIVEKPATLDLLRRDAPQLERALQDAGLKTSDNGLQFSLRDQQSQSGRQDDEQRRDMQRLMITEDETVPREAAGRSYGRMLSASGGIDMRV